MYTNNQILPELDPTKVIFRVSDCTKSSNSENDNINF